MSGIKSSKQILNFLNRILTQKCKNMIITLSWCMLKLFIYFRPFSQNDLIECVPTMLAWKPKRSSPFMIYSCPQCIYCILVSHSIQILTNQVWIYCCVSSRSWWLYYTRNSCCPCGYQIQYFVIGILKFYGAKFVTILLVFKSYWNYVCWS